MNPSSSGERFPSRRFVAANISRMYAQLKVTAMDRYLCTSSSEIFCPVSDCPLFGERKSKNPISCPLFFGFVVSCVF